MTRDAVNDAIYHAGRRGLKRQLEIMEAIKERVDTPVEITEKSDGGVIRDVGNNKLALVVSATVFSKSHAKCMQYLERAQVSEIRVTVHGMERFKVTLLGEAAVQTLKPGPIKL